MKNPCSSDLPLGFTPLEEKWDALARAEEIAASRADSKGTVIIADDERMIADTLAIILDRAGFKATPVYSGEDAIHVSETLLPDWLISDVVMGGINGIQTAIEIRRRLPECKILLVSGHAATSTLLGDLEASGQTFEILAKPVNPREILSRLLGN